MDNPWKILGKSMDNKNGKKGNVSVVLPCGSKNDDFGRLSRFPEHIYFLGVVFQNGFSPNAVQPEASGVWKKYKGPSGGPMIIW